MVEENQEEVLTEEKLTKLLQVRFEPSMYSKIERLAKQEKRKEVFTKNFGVINFGLHLFC